MPSCIQCHRQTVASAYRYCSNQCQGDYQYQEYILQWKRGKVDGNRGIRARNVSGHVRRYLFEKFGKSCLSCGWSQINKSTGKVPLEIDHIDGNPENNAENNLRLLCPNCHSLTPNFRNL